MLGDVLEEENRVSFHGGRLQNGFKGLVKVDGTSHRTFCTLTLNKTYLENPGTYADAAGGSVTQGTSDTVRSVYAVGAGATIVVDAPQKHTSRRANASYYAESGARIIYNGDGLQHYAQESLASGAVLFHCDETNPGKIQVQSLPRFISETDVEGGFTEVGGFGRPMIDRVIRDGRNSLAPDVSFPSAKPIAILVDGTTIADFDSINGVVDPLTVSTDAADVYRGARGISRSVVEMRGTTTTTTTPDGAYVEFTLPGWVQGKWLRARYLIQVEQVGAQLGAATQPLNIGIRVQQGASNPATIYPPDQTSVGRNPPSPGAGNKTDWLVDQQVFYCEAAGSVGVTVYLTTRDETVDDIGRVQMVAIDVLDGDGFDL